METSSIEVPNTGQHPEFSLNVVFREITNDGEPYVVAECIELPGCVSQGATQEEAHANMQDAMRLCLSVVFEDCMKRLMEQRPADSSLSGISSKGRMTIDPTPRLHYA